MFFTKILSDYTSATLTYYDSHTIYKKLIHQLTLFKKKTDVSVCSRVTRNNRRSHCGYPTLVIAITTRRKSFESHLQSHGQTINGPATC
jgi:hypothetical protein